MQIAYCIIRLRRGCLKIIMYCKLYTYTALCTMHTSFCMMIFHVTSCFAIMIEYKMTHKIELMFNYKNLTGPNFDQYKIRGHEKVASSVIHSRIFHFLVFTVLYLHSLKLTNMKFCLQTCFKFLLIFIILSIGRMP